MKGCMLTLTGRGIVLRCRDANDISLQPKCFLPIWHVGFCLWPWAQGFLGFFHWNPGDKPWAWGSSIRIRLFSIFSRTPDEVFLNNAVEMFSFLHYVFGNYALGGCCNTVAEAGGVFFFTSGHLSAFPFPFFFFSSCLYLNRTTVLVSPTQSVIDFLLLLVCLPFPISLFPSLLLPFFFTHLSVGATPPICFKDFPWL